MNSTFFRDIAILLARLGIGVIFLVHGLQKLIVNGYSGTKAGFESMEVPAPPVSAFIATWVEILGGVSLILGLLVPVFGVLLFLDMLGAYLFVHMGNGVYVNDGGWELVGALGLGSLLLAAVGAGAYSLDRFIAPKVPFMARA
ncbi:DoxX family protein [Rhodococcus sp. HM1]|uniref:DoxX family protein n=1 Tax=Rhodococcus sp. HM1 TaxID=2937759 RepID=UPI00200B3BA6|nr:DoxX family protein [Rhodococcus sp. HM1]MCK8672722.1 DoxX family protein [Rhodococcus sp. HM1]